MPVKKIFQFFDKEKALPGESRDKQRLKTLTELSHSFPLSHKILDNNKPPLEPSKNSPVGKLVQQLIGKEEIQIFQVRADFNEQIKHQKVSINDIIKIDAIIKKEPYNPDLKSLKAYLTFLSMKETGIDKIPVYRKCFVEIIDTFYEGCLSLLHLSWFFDIYIKYLQALYKRAESTIPKKVLFGEEATNYQTKYSIKLRQMERLLRQKNIIVSDMLKDAKKHSRKIAELIKTLNESRRSKMIAYALTNDNVTKMAVSLFIQNDKKTKIIDETAKVSSEEIRYLVYQILREISDIPVLNNIVWMLIKKLSLNSNRYLLKKYISAIKNINAQQNKSIETMLNNPTQTIFTHD